MKKLFLFAFVLIGFAFNSFSQTQKVEWAGTAVKIDNNTYKVTLTADVADGWYIYSQYMEEGGPVPTAIAFEGDYFKTEGKTEETGEVTKEMYDEVFEIDVKKFGKAATFTQIVKTNGKTPAITALVTYMSCNDERCNPPRQIKVPVEL